MKNAAFVRDTQAKWIAPILASFYSSIESHFITSKENRGWERERNNCEANLNQTEEKRKSFSSCVSIRVSEPKPIIIICIPYTQWNLLIWWFPSQILSTSPPNGIHCFSLPSLISLLETTTTMKFVAKNVIIPLYSLKFRYRYTHFVSLAFQTFNSQSERLS